MSSVSLKDFINGPRLNVFLLKIALTGSLYTILALAIERFLSISRFNSLNFYPFKRYFLFILSISLLYLSDFFVLPSMLSKSAGLTLNEVCLTHVFSYISSKSSSHNWCSHSPADRVSFLYIR